LKMPIYPFAVGSLFDPIVEAWNGGVGVSAEFWSGRRARPLREFIPVPQAHLRAMLRGWFTAEALGLLEVDGAVVRTVRDPSGLTPRRVAFPAPTLTQVSLEDDGHLDRPAVLLESIALAYLELIRTASLGSLDAYAALRDHGMSEPGHSSAVLRYDRPNPVLQAWIQTGEVAGSDELGGRVAPVLAEASTPAERAARLVERFRSIQRDIDKRLATYNEESRLRPARLSEPPQWPGISDEMWVALEALSRAVDRAQSRQGQ